MSAPRNVSSFDIIGPIMVGPSSSHTAGAVRLGLLGRAILGAPPTEALIELHGSFAHTGQGHGTDRAIVAGLLGMPPDDERIRASFAAAQAAGLNFRFEEVDLGDDA
ncbi:MAG: L-serine ammonia-lyase, iron-sulfur-dependent, subunit beta, partial [Chloroflexi bacterium]